MGPLRPAENEHDAPPVPLHASPGERRRLSVVVLLVLSAGAAWVLWRFLWPFASGIIIAVVLAVLAYPAYRWLCRRMPYRSLAALVGTTVLFFLVLIPIAGASMLVFRAIQGNVDSISQQAGALLAPDSPLRHGVHRLADWVGMGDVDFAQVARDQVRRLGGFLAGSTVGIVSGLGGALLQAAVALFTLYYLLEDGPELVRGITRLVPLDDELTEALLARSREIIFATVYGHVVVAIVQGTLAGLAWWILDLPAPVLWGTVMLVFSLLPAVGPPVVWGPAAIVLALQGEVWRAVALVAVGGLLIGAVDNMLRPYLVSDRAQLHPLVGFFSVLGGILLFGLTGLFLGPIVWVVAQTLLEVTRMVLDPEH